MPFAHSSKSPSQDPASEAPLAVVSETTSSNNPVALRDFPLLPTVAHKTITFSLEKAPLPEPILNPLNTMSEQTDWLDSSPVSPWLCDSG